MDARKQLFNDVVDRVWHRGDLAFIDQAYHPAYVANVPRRGFQDVEAFRQYVTEVRTAFPDIRIYVEDQIAEGDLVASRYRVVGTHTGPLMGLPATQRPIDVPGITIERLSGGRFAESWTCWDVIGLFHELGLIPEITELARGATRDRRLKLAERR